MRSALNTSDHDGSAEPSNSGFYSEQPFSEEPSADAEDTKATYRHSRELGRAAVAAPRSISLGERLAPAPLRRSWRSGRHVYDNTGRARLRET